jgi:hypothetical protein
MDRVPFASVALPFASVKVMVRLTLLTKSLGSTTATLANGSIVLPADTDCPATVPDMIGIIVSVSSIVV